MLYVANSRYDSQTLAAMTIQTPKRSRKSRTTTTGPPTANAVPMIANAASHA